MFSCGAVAIWVVVAGVAGTAGAEARIEAAGSRLQAPGPERKGTLRLCVSNTPEEHAAAEWLGRFLSTVRVEAATDCRATRRGQGGLEGHFETRGGQVTFVVRARSGQALVRVVPWIRDAVTPLAALAAGDRLSEFSILVDGILAEHRSEPPPARSTEPAPGSEPVPGPQAEVWSARAGEGATSPVPSLGSSFVLADLTSAPPPVPALAPVSDLPALPPAVRPAPAVPARAPRPEAPAPAVVRTGAPVTPAGAPRRERGVEVEGWAGVIRRAPGLSAAQLGGTLGFRRFFLRLGVDRADWRWEGRAIAFSGWMADLGGRLPLGTWPRARLRLDGTVSLLLERIVLRRQDVAGAASHPFWDGGALLGAQVVVSPRPWWHLGLFADAGFRPTWRNVQVQAGPGVALNAWSARAALQAGLSW
jgi:hypothetical protein